MSGESQVSFDQLSAELQKGVNLYEVIGKLYVATLAKDQAIAVAASAIKQLLPKEPLPTTGPDVNPDGSPVSPSSPMAPPDVPVFASVADLPSEAPQGAVVAVVDRTAEGLDAVAPATRSPRSKRRGR